MAVRRRWSRKPPSTYDYGAHAAQSHLADVLGVLEQQLCQVGSLAIRLYPSLHGGHAVPHVCVIAYACYNRVGGCNLRQREETDWAP